MAITDNNVEAGGASHAQDGQWTICSIMEKGVCSCRIEEHF